MGLEKVLNTLTNNQVKPLTPLVRLLTAPNHGPLTYKGTNTYLVGDTKLAVIDPGPDMDGHLNALIAAIGDKTVSHIVVTHTHRDHSPLASKLQERTGAPIVGCPPHAPARSLLQGEVKSRANDYAYTPDQALADGDIVAGDGWHLTAVATPGHTANHLAFSLEEEQVLFSGDHVMGWNTTVVTPPDGSMAAYLASLQKCLKRSDDRYFPGHGDPIEKPHQYVSSLYKYRLQREAAILDHLTTLGPQIIDQIVERLYKGLSWELTEAAALTVYAHLEKLCADGKVTAQGSVVSRSAIYQSV